MIKMYASSIERKLFMIDWLILMKWSFELKEQYKLLEILRVLISLLLIGWDDLRLIEEAK